jgi:hypothetical protein
MASRDRDVGGKYMSGNEKRKRKLKSKAFIKTQENSLVRYVAITSTSTTNNNKTADEERPQNKQNQEEKLTKGNAETDDEEPLNEQELELDGDQIDEIKQHENESDQNDTTGRGVYEEINTILTDERLKLFDSRGRGYDNGTNMKGAYYGVQANILRENKKTFYVPCASHNLNLVLVDIAKSSSKAVHYFGTLQKIYTTFAGSTSRWSILKQYVTSLTPKPLSETRWECPTDSVKAIRFQIPNLRDALNALANHDNKLKAETLAIQRNSYPDTNVMSSGR